mmetsp:Transcript_19442/g.41900  ORF Transcript_19442/g.41900 Transcript_19442/m.41900 type:complete len:420 (-) Transcript_19442:385-1644(-)
MGNAIGRCSRSNDSAEVSQRSASLFKRFRIDSSKVLGSGGFGKAVIALDVQTNLRVAAKLISTAKINSEKLLREVEIMQKSGAGCQYICEVFGAGQRKNEYVIFLELCEGGELYKMVESRGTLTEPEARGFFTQLMKGVAHCHRIGVLHRDLKLENIMLCKDMKQLRIIDFGLAHQFQRRADGTVVHIPLKHCCGSPAYCAPEVLCPRFGYGFGADVWSCGVALFALLLGFFPVEEATSHDWRFDKLKVAQREGKCTVTTILQWYRRPQHLSVAAVDLIDQMLEIEHRSRITADACLGHVWITGGEPVVDPPTTETSSSLIESPTAKRKFDGSAASSTWGSYATYAAAGVRRVISGVTGFDLLDGDAAPLSGGRPTYRAAEIDEHLRSVRAVKLDVIPPFVERQLRFGDTFQLKEGGGR